MFQAVEANWDADVERYNYRDHLEALRHLCQERTPRDEFALVLDADMVVSSELLTEAKTLLTDQRADVAIAPVIMYWSGQRLERGSLYPPKPFMFRGGSTLLRSSGTWRSPGSRHPRSCHHASTCPQRSQIVRGLSGEPVAVF